MSLESPIVMGILNATPDSFYQHDEGADAIRLRTRQMLAEGAEILDVGACSTRPGYTAPDEKEEIYDYFKNAENDSIKLAMEELGEDYYDEMHVRLVRIKFHCDLGN